MTDLPGGLASGLGGALGGMLGGVSDLVGGVLGGATQVVAKTGDTLGSIADAHGVPLSTVVEANPQVLHPDLVQPGQAITVPQGGASPAAPPTPGADAGQAQGQPGQGQPAPGGGLGQALGQGVGQTAAAAGAVVGQAVGATGALVGQTVAAAGADVNQALGQGAQTGLPGAPAPAGLAGGAPPASPGEPAPSTALPQAPVSVTIGQGSADFRVLAQAAPPLSPTLAATPGAPTLMQALARIDPALAQLLATALASPTLSTPASAAQLAKLETALLSLGWAAVTLGLAKPGDVVLLLRAAILQAARVPAEGLGSLIQASGPTGSSTADVRALSPPQGQPVGVDAAAPKELRRRAPGEDADAAKAQDKPPSEREPPPTPHRAWIDRALPAARAVKARWGVPIAVTLAQGAVASDWGRLAPGNDFFGLGERRAGLPALPPPRAGVPMILGDRAEVFADVDEAADAFGAYLNADPRFARAFRASDPAAFARRLAEAGFAADPRHGETLAAVMEHHGLFAFDL